MHGLGIPTTQALCLTGSPSPVLREEVETAAVVTRTAPSFLRFGHFEHFSHSGRHDLLRKLADHVIERFYPDCAGAPEPYAQLLQAVVDRTARLMAQWQAVGFCHGVMNTDNMSILGLTLDYGPFQFLDGFDPEHICNHSDTGGRYAYKRQPSVAHWNLFCLGQALMPLIGDKELALAALETYKGVFEAAMLGHYRAKLGLIDAPQPGDEALVDDLMPLLAKDRVDHTIFGGACATSPTNPSRCETCSLPAVHLTPGPRSTASAARASIPRSKGSRCADATHAMCCATTWASRSYRRPRRATLHPCAI